MDLDVFLAVLAAAACHALWNAGLKMRLDPAVAITLISIAAGIIALPFWPVFGTPDIASWPYIAASLFLHIFYYTYLAEAYRTADLTQVYPIARGSAPLMTAIGSAALFGELLGPLGWAGVALLAAGVLLLSLRGGRDLHFDRRGIGFAFATACTIAAYTLVDGRGARLSGNPHAYAVVLFVLDGIMMAAYGWLLQRDEIRATIRQGWQVALGGAVLALVSYWIAIWAMTKAPIALVASVRETSVLFAALIGIVLLKEPLVRARILSAILVMCGLVLIRLH